MIGVVTRRLDPAVERVYHNRLEQNFPNPFNPTTTISFSIKDAGNVSLIIYDVAGRRVRELLNQRRDRGAYNVVWDGHNDGGSKVASGVYFYRMVAGSFVDTKKLTILK
jgi:flagellar hook assembly protein FlgD